MRRENEKVHEDDESWESVERERGEKGERSGFASRVQKEGSRSNDSVMSPFSPFLFTSRSAISVIALHLPCF
jgi:hypothetical protein